MAIQNFTICLLDYDMANISYTLESLSHQLFKNIKIIIPNNGKSDLSFRFCQMFKRHHPFIDIELIDVICDEQATITYLKSGNFNNIFVLSGKYEKLSDKLYLYDASQNLSFAQFENAQFDRRTCTNASLQFRKNAFYKNAEKLAYQYASYCSLNEQDILVSVIIASYNYEKYIGQAIDSVLHQTYKNIEILVVDDGSTDNSVEVIKMYCQNNANVKLLQHCDKQNHGLNESLKYAIVKAKGEYIAFCEADDILHPENIAKKINLVKRYSGKPLIIANDILVFGEPKRTKLLQQVVDEKMNLLNRECNEIIGDIIQHNNLIATFSSVMLKKSSILKCSFNSSFICCTDWWLYSQILKEDNHIYVVHEKLTSWRAHKSFAMQSMDGILNKNINSITQSQQFINNLHIMQQYRNNISETIKVKYSFIITSYNYAKYISNTIDSILAQTYKDFEIIIIDDGSTDNTMDILNKYAMRNTCIHIYQHIDKKNHGLSDSTKLGISHALGQYIIFCESDDYLNPLYLELKNNLVNKYNNKPSIIINDIELICDKTSNKHKLINEINYRKQFFKYECNKIDIKLFEKINYICTFSCVMVKKSILSKLNFNTPCQVNLDWWLWAQIAKIDNNIYYVNKKLTYWRQHSDSYMGKQKNLSQSKEFKTFSKQISQFLK